MREEVGAAGGVCVESARCFTFYIYPVGRSVGFVARGGDVSDIDSERNRGKIANFGGGGGKLNNSRFCPFDPISCGDVIIQNLR